MINAKYPISGPLREPSLFLECILFFFVLEIGVILFQKYTRSKKVVRTTQKLASSLFFFLLSVNWLWRILSDYIMNDPQIRYLFVSLSYLIQMFGVFLYILSIEIKKKLVRRYLFTGIISGLIITFIITFILNYAGLFLILLINWFVFLIFFVIYLKALNLKLQIEENLKSRIFIFYSGIILLLLGFTLSTDLFINIFGLEIRIIATILQLLAVGFIYLFLSQILPFAEFDWFDKIESLYLMERSGLVLYQKLFKKDVKNIDSILIGGSIMSAHLMLEKTIDKKGFSVIKKPDKTTIIYSGKYITGVIFSKEDLNSLKILLQKLIFKTEEIYENVFRSWDGNLAVFEPIESLCNEIFVKK